MYSTYGMTDVQHTSNWQLLITFLTTTYYHSIYIILINYIITTYYHSIYIIFILFCLVSHMLYVPMKLNNAGKGQGAPLAIDGQRNLVST